MVMAEDRTMAQQALIIFANTQKINLITIEAVVSNLSYYAKMCQVCKKKPLWIDNSKRNEKKILSVIEKRKIEAVISLQYRWIISNKIIQTLKGYAFNIHFGKLPDYRGHHALIHAILNNEKFFFMTLQWMLPEVDRGLNAYEEAIEIKPNDTSWSLYQKCFAKALKMLEKLINNLGKEKKIPQTKIAGKDRYYKIKSIEGLKEIFSLNDFTELDKKTRAFYFPPHEPAYFVLKGKKFYVIPKLPYV